MIHVKKSINRNLLDQWADIDEEDDPEKVKDYYYMYKDLDDFDLA
jgi:hypothetical protein